MDEGKLSTRDYIILGFISLGTSALTTLAYHYRGDIRNMFDRSKDFGKKYDIPLDDLADKLYSKFEERIRPMEEKMNAQSQRIDELIRRYSPDR